MTKQDIFDAISQSPVFHLATVEGDKPHVRGMLLYRADEDGIIFHTSLRKDLPLQLAQNANVELCFQAQGTQIRVSGKVEKVECDALRREICNAPGREFLKGWLAEQGEAQFMSEFVVYRLLGGEATTWTMADNFAAKQPISLRREMRVLVLDNYDSFTYNLVHYLRDIVKGFGSVEVFRNDEISIADVAKYDKILLSPGPGIPDEAGILKELIATYGATKSIFGVCLGCQAIAEVFGGSIRNMQKVFHGLAMTAIVEDKDEYIFNNLPSQFLTGRYHSWVVDEAVPTTLVVTSRDEEGLVMGVRHAQYDVRGVQFHPESILTEGGMQMIRNWIEH